MLVKQLIDAIASEKLRIWGPMGFDGRSDQLAWLQQSFGVSEEDLAIWSAIVLHEFDGSLMREHDDQLLAILSSRNEIAGFLYGLLHKYRSSNNVYRADPLQKGPRGRLR